MKPYEYFGLHTPPFDTTPDPRFYTASSGHAEALATLQYATHTHKPCVVVLGESGSGKTLIARLMAQQVDTRRGVLWVHGLGQPNEQTNVTYWSPASSRRGSANHRPRRVEESALSTWVRSHVAETLPTLLVVDNADGLPHHCWEDIVAVVTREVRTPQPLSVILLGLPGLMRTLASAPLVRLRRRIFRTCQLTRLSRDEVGRYVQHRLAVAGSHRNNRLFTGSALDLIHRTSAGNPALINQICDNALIDAFGDDRSQIDAPDIVATVHAITGGLTPTTALPQPKHNTPPVLTDDTTVESPGRDDAFRYTMPAVPSPEVVATPLKVATTSHSRHAHDDAEHASETRVGTAQRVVSAALAATDVSYRPLDERLAALEHRLTDALERVRVARSSRDIEAIGGAGEPDAVAAESARTDT